jgi:hypothetical protein
MTTLLALSAWVGAVWLGLRRARQPSRTFRPSIYWAASARHPAISRGPGLMAWNPEDASGDRGYISQVTELSTEAPAVPRLHCGIVLRVEEDVCQVLIEGQVVSVLYSSHFPAPRKERVSPGHLVAVAEVAGDSGVVGVVLWRWYDAVVLGNEAGSVRLWEPAHGEVVAQPRRPGQRLEPGTRAYLSAGLPGAQWWVCGQTVAKAEDADVELDEVERLYTEHGMWDPVAGA